MHFGHKLIVVFLVSLVSTYLVIWLARLLSFGIDAVKGKKHCTHKRAVPRLGGLGIFAGFAAGYYLFGLDFIAPTLMLCVALPFLLGLVEDVTQRLSANFRFLMMALFSLTALFLVGDLIVYDIGVDLPVYAAVPLTILAFTGLANAINLIDGFNGLAAGISAMAFAGLAMVSYLHFRQGVFATSLTMLFSIAGFVVFNFPGGRIFLGDGGAYFMGFMLALLSALLINRGIGIISPWFPVALLLYPLTDTLFAIYRRRVLKGRKAFAADLLHMHSLVYKRVARKNHLTSIYVLLFNLPFTVFAVLLYRNTVGLIVLCGFYVMGYVTLYMAIVNFRIKKVVGNPMLPADGEGIKLL